VTVVPCRHQVKQARKIFCEWFNYIAQFNCSSTAMAGHCFRLTVSGVKAADATAPKPRTFIDAARRILQIPVPDGHRE
jgi:hypothetical protein